MHFEKKKHIAAYLKWNLKIKKAFDLPCHTKLDVQEEFRKKLRNVCSQLRPTNAARIEIVKILVPLTDNHDAPDKNGLTTIYLAAQNGHLEIIKTLAPLTDNPNAPNKFRVTPIHRAAFRGHTEIVKILAPLTDNPNAPNNDGNTPSSVAKNAEIRKFLESFNTSRKRKAEPSIKPSKK